MSARGQRSRRAGVAAAVAAVLAGPAGAGAQPADRPGADPRLEVDDCPRLDPTASPELLKSQGAELYSRSELLYAQGDYPGAVRELISAYCISLGLRTAGAMEFARILKDIAQAHERALDYERAVAYLERYLAALPQGADPAERAVTASRIVVLRKLRAQILVETEPRGAAVTLSNAAGVAGRGPAGRPIEVPGGRYSMVVERPGYEPYEREIEVRIGKPFAYFVPLRPLRGRISAQVTPADARVFLRDRTLERFAGVGRVEESLPVGAYVLIAEAPGRERLERPVEVHAGRTALLQLELQQRPQYARLRLVAAAAALGVTSGSGLAFASGDSAVALAGGVGGGALGLFGALLYLPDQVPLGAANLTITAGVIGGVAGYAAARVLTGRERIAQPIQGAGALLGTALGYYVGAREAVSPGEAALINSSALWGTAMGSLFALSFGAEDSRVSAGLVVTGLGLGAVSGVLMARSYQVSRRRAVLIDIGGIAGLLGGLASERLVYSTVSDDPSVEQAANFSIGGLALGLIGAGILTRNLDAPKLGVKPAIGTATTSLGGHTLTYGLGGAW